jgi:hypothetical protein
MPKTNGQGATINYGATPFQYAVPPGFAPMDAAASTTHTYAASGGLQTGGSATLSKVKIPTASGGLQTGGSATLAKIKAFIASGGLQLAGTATRAKIKAPSVSGGAQFGGSATYSGPHPVASYSYSGSGLLQFGGTAVTIRIGWTMAGKADRGWTRVSEALSDIYDGQIFDPDIFDSSIELWAKAGGGVADWNRA